MSSNHSFNRFLITDLRRAHPQDNDLVKATFRLFHHKPIHALRYVFTALKLQPKLCGQRNSILRFMHDPLSWGLYITSPLPGQHCQDSVFVHTDFWTLEFCLHDKEDLIQVMRIVLHMRDQLAKTRHASLRPGWKTDTELLQRLYTGKHLRFKEADRALKRGCPLDAMMEICLPFGLQPRFEEDDRIVFLHRFMRDGWNLFDTKGEMVGVSTSHAWVTRCLYILPTFVVLNDPAGKKQYDLALPADRDALMRRLLGLRAYLRAQHRALYHISVWQGKRPGWNNDARKPSATEKKLAVSRQASSPLSREVRPEDVGDEDEDEERKRVTRAMEHEAMANAMSRDWLAGRSGTELAVRDVDMVDEQDGDLQRALFS